MVMLYEGKAKQIFSTEKENEVIIHYKDDATAFNGLKKDTVSSKGIYNNKITTYLYNELNKRGIPTHYIKTINERDQLCKKVSIVPLEVIVRNIIAGSLAKKFNIAEGPLPKCTINEICYKDDELGDPMINDSQAIGMGFCTREELDTIYELTNKVNDILKEIFLSINVKLVDFKLEFGKDENGNILLADEISCDTCRFWDATTNEKLDKDRFRRDMGNVIGAYEEIWSRLEKRG